ncbi:restriction endonuclease subunit S [Actinokineospora sp.]|uniref:restriction endonuclease subunit S n=1 Tax=Actinokineospora sp. TaxID=1872133 RepID=UPI003D6AFEA9
MTSPKRLGEVCSIIMGQAPNGDFYNTGGHGWPLIAGPGDFDGLTLAPKKYTTVAPKVTRPGDVVIGVRASIGDKVLADGEYCLGRGVAALRPGDLLDVRFLWHWLTYYAPSLAAKGKGATFKQVSRKDIADLSIDVPSKPEQRRIAGFFDEVDLLRAKRRQVMTLLDDLAVSAFMDRFGDGNGASAESLGDHLTFLTSGGRGWGKYYAENGARFIRSLDVRMNYIGDVDAAFVRAPSNAEARRTRVQKGDVLLTITGSLIGRAAPVVKDFGEAYVSQHVAILRVSSKSLRPEFLSFYLTLPFGGQRQIGELQYGQTKPGLNFAQIRNLVIPVPSLGDQDEFLSMLAEIGRNRRLCENQLAALDALSESLRYRAFHAGLWAELCRAD